MGVGRSGRLRERGVKTAMKNTWMSSTRGLTVLAVAAALACPASAQSPGELLGYQKIATGTPGFGHPLKTDDQFGGAAARIDDRDGNPVFVIGTPRDDDGATDAGAVWILSLLPDGTVAEMGKISDTEGGFTGDLGFKDRFGRSVTALGDLDGDGVGDLAVGADRDDDGGMNRGCIYILFLNADWTVKAHQKISSTEGNFLGELDDDDYFGHATANLGDVDGDGVIDLVAGVYDDDGGFNRGGVWILFLNTDGTVKSHAKISSTEGNFVGELTNQDYFGWAVAGLGDFDGDLVPDFLVSSIRDNDGGPSHGALHLIFLNADGSVKAFQRISEEAGGFTGVLDAEDFGYSVSGIGDVDGNGVTDIAVGAPRNLDGGYEKGAVWIIKLQADGTVLSHTKISALSPGFETPLDPQDWFGSALLNTGDLNGDGVEDLLVGARYDDTGGLNLGAAYVTFLHGPGVPFADFSATPTSGVTPLEVAFDDQSRGSVTTALWDFGDGETSTELEPVHKYAKAGTYTVSFDVAGPLGADGVVKEDYIAVDKNFGCGIHPWSSLTVLGGFPGTGRTYRLGIDDPSEAKVVNAATGLFVSLKPAPNIPCGTPGFGQATPDGGGELLVDVARLVAFLPGPIWTGAGRPAPIELAFPDHASLVGLELYLQGVIHGPGLTTFTEGLVTTIRP